MPKRSLGTAEWIKNHLQEHNSDYPKHMHKQYCSWCSDNNYPEPTYDSFRREIWILKKLNLIKQTHTEPNPEKPHLFNRSYYKLNPTKVDSNAWNDPTGTYYNNR